MPDLRERRLLYAIEFDRFCFRGTVCQPSKDSTAMSDPVVTPDETLPSSTVKTWTAPQLQRLDVGQAENDVTPGSDGITSAS